MSEIVMRQVDGITVLDVTRSFMQISRTSEERPKLRQLVTESLDSGHNKIVLNLSQVVYFSNTALGELIGVFKTIRERGGHLKLSNVPPSVRAGLELSRLIKIFDICADEAAAIQSFDVCNNEAAILFSPTASEGPMSSVESFPPAPKGSMSQIGMRQVDGITVLDITKSFMQISGTSEECGQLRQLVTESLDSGHNKILLNLSQVVSCSNTALGEFNRVLTMIRRRGGHLKLSNIPSRVRTVLELTHLITIYDVSDNEAAAIQSFKSTA